MVWFLNTGFTLQVPTKFTSIPCFVESIPIGHSPNFKVTYLKYLNIYGNV